MRRKAGARQRGSSRGGFPAFRLAVGGPIVVSAFFWSYGSAALASDGMALLLSAMLFFSPTVAISSRLWRVTVLRVAVVVVLFYPTIPVAHGVGLRPPRSMRETPVSG